MVGVAAGLTNRELAAWTGWTEDTVETYFKHLNAKLAIHSRGQAIHQVIEELLDQLDMREGAESAASEGR